MEKELNSSKFQIHQPVRVTTTGKWLGYRGIIKSIHNGIVDVDFGERSPKTPRGKRLNVSFSENELEDHAMLLPALPTVRHISREYREFYIYTRIPLKGGIAVHASNETWKIRLEQHYHNIEPNKAWERMNAADRRQLNCRMRTAHC